MTKKPSYEELEQRIEELEREADEHKYRVAVLSGSEKKWRSMLESVPISIAVADREGTVQYINRAAPEMSVEKTNGVCINNFEDPQHHFISRHAIEEVFQSGRTGSYQVRGIDAEANTSWYEINFSPIKCGEQVVAAMFLALDITERERGVRVRDRAIESSINGIAFADLQGNLTYVNESFLKMWGYEDNEEVVGRPAVEFWERQEDSLKVIETLRRRGNWMGGLVAKRKNGSLFDVHLSASMITDEDGKRVLMMGSIIDITKYKRAEEALKESEQRYRLLVETMSDGLGVQDENSLLTYVNDRICEMLGYSRGEVIGRPVTDFLDKANRAILNRQMARRRKGERSSYELSWTAKDGEKVPTIISPEPIFDTQGQFKGSFAVVTEILELKQVEKALRQREKELETKTKTLEEVNTTLNALLNKRDEEKTELEKNVLSNLKKLVMPYLEKLKGSGSDERQQVYIGNLESTLNDIISPLSRRLPNLSPTEIQVANLVKQGRRSREIAELMNLSTRTIESHRDNIRKKIGIKTKKNLRTYLLSVQDTDFFKTLLAHG